MKKRSFEAGVEDRRSDGGGDDDDNKLVRERWDDSNRDLSSTAWRSSSVQHITPELTYQACNQPSYEFRNACRSTSVLPATWAVLQIGLRGGHLGEFFGNKCP